MDEIKLHIVSDYKMPALCCACGAPAGKVQFKVYASSMWQHRPYGLYLPLCDRCAQAYRTVDQRRRTGCWISLVVALLLGAAGILIEVVGNAARPWGSWLALLAFLVIAAGIIVFQALPWLLARELRAPFRRVVHAARIRHYRPSGLLGDGTMVLDLAQPQFAAQFRLLNQQSLWQEPGR